MRPLRFGLSRHSYCTYKAAGPCGEFLIRRVGRRRYFVSDARFPTRPGFFDQKFTRFRDAALYARKIAGVDVPFDPALDLPKFLDRRQGARAA